ncbi:tetratricopeptide repeat protein [Roseofilum capinflatum]|uniref:Tetratricopeptide repeat protein n=1 Tax=Roseofilum capinflatum BLCC-M114 TaxID=3022440 RepID=A0ABT7B1G2_9CYAN|nr:tetratricopeptide repeat protein [Roseofilum capinflatum]MDJ1172672.1 tetratricopeptide repeat protein [Roseofilum capinflatum BLCC-M114]
MRDPELDGLLSDLQSDSEPVREQAIQELWRRWFNQKGMMGFKRLQQAQRVLETGQFERAEEMLTEVIHAWPDFAEAWNRRAVLYYMRREYYKAIADCEEVMRLNPNHFGALHGLGLCHAALAQYRQAIAAFRQASAIVPHAIENQRLILECTARLN